ncbi:MAG: ParB N-terminal domain-containing protein [Clostridia bacterium]|nr:ParB N-terminal domain-containing protein [Clostridia bacterium]
MQEKIVYKSMSELHPYKKNPRRNKDAIDPVAASIKEFGFRSPLQVTADGTIINGHTRFQAAKKLGLKEVPCVVIDNLSEEQIQEYRLIDNKTSEYAAWDKDLLAGELMGLDFGNLDFGFDFADDVKKEKRWAESKKKCDLTDKVTVRKANGEYYQCLMKTGNKGIPLESIKTEKHVPFIAENAIEFIREMSGGNLSECGWCLLTTPRRRHAEGFHFATAVCEYIAGELLIPFYPDVATCKNRDRINPEFTMHVWPEEKNVILYDDILTTGRTVKAMRELLVEAGYTVLTVISIDNH